MSFTSDTHPVAKNAHRCYLCGRPIRIGEKYTKRVGVDDGDFWSIHMHNFCSDVARKEYDMDSWMDHERDEFRELLDQHTRLLSNSV
jgi:hypothetical protein